MFSLIPFERRGNIGYYNPFRELEELERSFFSGRPAVSPFRTDIRDTGDAYILETDLPGFAKEDISLSVDKGILTLSAEHKTENEEKNENNTYIRRERSYGSYRRSFDISGVSENEITADFSNGVLEITLPKEKEKEEAVRKIDIN